MIKIADRLVKEAVFLWWEKYLSFLFSVSPKWLKLLTGFKQKEKLAVDYFDTKTLEIKQTEMFIEGYKKCL